MANWPEVICGELKSESSGPGGGGGNETFSPSMETPPGLKGLKTTLTESLAATGWPLRVAGAKAQD